MSFFSSTGQKIIFYLIIIVIIIYFINKWLKKKSREYHSQEYWENRYSWYTQEMDWYTNFTQINNDFQIETILKENFQNPKKCKFLELGCGNSTMSFDLYELGYKNITSIDFSSIVIEKMKEKYKNTKINFLVCDFNRMNEMFEKNEFDIIIEKAGLDSIAVKNTPDVPISLFNIYEKMFFVLKNNGIVLSISSKNPQFWKSNVFEELEKKNLFKCIQIRRTTFVNEKNPIVANLYFYYLKKM
jgi:ubiquinone/menaquinone biosynthesis C-methylase UbiE